MSEHAPSGYRSGYAFGFVVGLVIAAVFALVISVLPSVLFEPGPWRIVTLIVAGPLLAAPTVWLLWALAQWRGLDRTVTLVAATTGAMAFDGVALSLVPGLYGQTGDALAGVGAVLLVAFASLAAAGYAMTVRTSRRPAGVTASV